MPIPHADTASIAPEKLTDYLLNDQHPVGRSKAKWFRSLGYDPSYPVVLEQDLLKLVRSSDAHTVKSSPFGTK